MLKYILTFLFLGILFSKGSAQDQITTVNGAVIDCEITSVDSSGVSFITNYGNEPVNSFGKIETIKSIKINRKTYNVSDLSKEELNNLMQKGSSKFDPNRPEQNSTFVIDIFLPSPAIEAKAGAKSSILFAFQPGFIWQKVNNEPTKTYFVPQGRIAYRSFYNFDNRRAQGKSTNKFSGSFISFGGMVTGATEVNPSYTTIMATTGIQRVWENIFHFSFEIGPGFIISKAEVTNPITIYLDLRFGFAL